MELDNPSVAQTKAPGDGENADLDSETTVTFRLTERKRRALKALAASRGTTILQLCNDGVDLILSASVGA